MYRQPVKCKTGPLLPRSGHRSNRHWRPHDRCSDRMPVVDDLIAYKQKVDQDRLKALEELAAEAQKHGMGY